MDKKISVEEYLHFSEKWNRGEFPEQRFGQAFCNTFNIKDSDLFYEELVYDCGLKILEYINLEEDEN